jgi:hypothetical protein
LGDLIGFVSQIGDGSDQRHKFLLVFFIIIISFK